MNRDTPFSSAVVDLSAGATLDVPEVGRRYMSVMVVDQDRYVTEVLHEAGSHDLTVAARLLVDPDDPAEVTRVNAAQDELRLRAAASSVPSARGRRWTRSGT